MNISNGSLNATQTLARPPAWTKATLFQEFSPSLLVASEECDDGINLLRLNFMAAIMQLQINACALIRAQGIDAAAALRQEEVLLGRGRVEVTGGLPQDTVIVGRAP